MSTCPGFNLLAVRAVLCTFQHKSVWSGQRDDLTIYRTQPPSLANAMVLGVCKVNRKVLYAVLVKAKAMAAMAALAFKRTPALFRPTSLCKSHPLGNGVRS